ncbi:protein CHLOROPLAST IMPORT APPARATUS 2-like [Lolium perenne]|uniref:protein CHLOROPLAST IMPORT APPARATUS 2-like n=1 Tax=Lolium perenne TaxID=4522 RepID=UPI0021F556C8|nr:protein CHLOROPLAST IMPORT APPARATUS 2-like [Lolium perenne]
MASCIPTGGGLRLPDLDMVKAAAAAAGGAAAPPPLRPASHSSASSTLSEASHSSSTSSLSLKRARTPRKRPNQTYNEAAALLASMYPSVFPAAAAAGGGHTTRLLGLASALADDAACADLLPPFPVLGNAACLLRDAPPPPSPRSPVLSKTCLSPAAVSSAFFTEFRDSAPSPATPDGAAADEPGELDFDSDSDGFDADSFLLGPDDGAAAEGIDGIMGKLTMETISFPASGALSSSAVDPFIRSLMVLGLGFQRSRPNVKQALKRHDDDSEWWMCPAIPLKDITPAPPAPPPALEKKKKKTKKKALKDIAVGPCRKCEDEIPDSVYGDDGILALKAPKTGLGLSLNTEEVLKAWYDRGSVFADGNVPESSSADGLAKSSAIELFLENGAAGAIREGGIKKMQHRQKQCTPLLSNKTRYQARKVNAECRPRVKGRFASQASLLQNAVKKES